MSEAVRIGSLFSGAGGLDMAVEQVFGGEVVWHCENDAAASKVLAQRWPGVPNHGDITEVNFSQRRAEVEPVDVLCGGWPCQPFSLAGKRKGIDDERALWPHVARAVRELRPRFVVLENVSAVVVLGELARAAGDLAEVGYDAQWTCLSASEVGAPHKRERFFLFAADAGNGAFDGERSRPESGQGGAAVADTAGERRAGCFESQPDMVSDRPELAHVDPHRRAVDLLPTPTSRDHKGANQRQDTTCLHGALLCTPSASDGAGGKTSRSGGRIDEPLLGGQAREMASSWGKYEAAIRRWERVTRPAPSPTEPNSKGNPRLSAAFSEWLMGWPEGWVTQVPGISRNDQLRIIGNGVVVAQAIAAIGWLLQVSEIAA